MGYNVEKRQAITFVKLGEFLKKAKDTDKLYIHPKINILNPYGDLKQEGMTDNVKLVNDWRC